MQSQAYKQGTYVFMGQIRPETVQRMNLKPSLRSLCKQEAPSCETFGTVA